MSDQTISAKEMALLGISDEDAAVLFGEPEAAEPRYVAIMNEMAETIRREPGYLDFQRLELRAVEITGKKDYGRKFLQPLGVKIVTFKNKPAKMPEMDGYTAAVHEQFERHVEDLEAKAQAKNQEAKPAEEAQQYKLKNGRKKKRDHIDITEDAYELGFRKGYGRDVLTPKFREFLAKHGVGCGNGDGPMTDACAQEFLDWVTFELKDKEDAPTMVHQRILSKALELGMSESDLRMVLHLPIANRRKLMDSEVLKELEAKVDQMLSEKQPTAEVVQEVPPDAMPAEDAQGEQTETQSPELEPHIDKRKLLPETVKQGYLEPLKDESGQVLGPTFYFDYLNVKPPKENFQITDDASAEWFIKLIRMIQNRIEDTVKMCTAMVKQDIAAIYGLMWYFQPGLWQWAESKLDLVKSGERKGQYRTKNVKRLVGAVFFRKTGGIQLRSKYELTHWFEEVATEEERQALLAVGAFKVKYEPRVGTLKEIMKDQQIMLPGFVEEPSHELGRIGIGVERMWSWDTVKKAFSKAMKLVELKGDVLEGDEEI